MTKAYPTLLTQTHDKKDTFLIEVPDLEIITEGYGLEDAIYMARDAIGLKGVCMMNDGVKIPEPSDICNVDASIGTFSDVGKPIVTLVDIDFDEYKRRNDNKSVRRNVTLPNWLNQAAEQANLNVSRVLQDALKEKLGLSRT